MYLLIPSIAQKHISGIAADVFEASSVTQRCHMTSEHAYTAPL